MAGIPQHREHSSPSQLLDLNGSHSTEPLTAAHTNSEGQTVGSGSSEPRFSESSQGNSGNGSSQAWPVSPRCVLPMSSGHCQGETARWPDLPKDPLSRDIPGWTTDAADGRRGYRARTEAAPSLWSCVWTRHRPPPVFQLPPGPSAAVLSFRNNTIRAILEAAPGVPPSFFPVAHYCGCQQDRSRLHPRPLTERTLPQI